MREFKCRECGATLESWGGEDVDCGCGALYNAFGQRLRERYAFDEDQGRMVDQWGE